MALRAHAMLPCIDCLCSPDRSRPHHSSARPSRQLSALTATSCRMLHTALRHCHVTSLHAALRHCHVTSHAPHGASSLRRHVAPHGASSLPRHVAPRGASPELHTSPDASHLLRGSPPPRDPPVTARFSLSPRPSPPLACMLISGEISGSISRPSPPLACSASSASEAGNKVHSRHLDGLLPFAQIAPQLPLESLA